MSEITVEAKIENVGKVTDWIDEQLEERGCPMKAELQINVAIDELLSNIAYYAYGIESGEATVRFEIMDDPLAAVITLLDHGKPYDPLTAEEPDITLSAEERKVGGLGIFIVKKTMDEITYKYHEGQNILMIKKHF